LESTKGTKDSEKTDIKDIRGAVRFMIRKG
jgi:hypothetical protein